MSLDPKWDRLLEKDNVTLQCRGAYPKEDNSTRWLHNGKPLPGQSSTYVIADAQVKDSGNYSCQTASFTLSDPVQLKVHAGEWAKGTSVRREARREVGGAREDEQGLRMKTRRSVVPLDYFCIVVLATVGRGPCQTWHVTGTDLQPCPVPGATFREYSQHGGGV